jgi:hypothetical protein
MALANINKRDHAVAALAEMSSGQVKQRVRIRGGRRRDGHACGCAGEWSHRGISTPVSATLMPALGRVVSSNCGN